MGRSAGLRVCALGSLAAATAVVAAGASVGSASNRASACSSAAGRYGACRAWSEPQLIAARAGGGVIAANTHGTRGRVYAAWLQGGQVMLATWWDGGWGPPEPVASPGAEATGLSAAVSDDGRVLVAWAQAGDVWAQVVGAAAANVSRSPAESADPQAAYLPALGFVVAWRETLAAGGGYASQRGVAESQLAETGWTQPIARYAPAPTSGSGVATVTTVGPIATSGDSLVIPFTTLDTHTVRASAAALLWDGHTWSRTGFSPAGACGDAGAGLPRDAAVLTFRECTGAVGRISTASGGDLTGDVSQPDVVGPPVVATAAGRMLVAWSQAGGVQSSFSSDGVAWTAPGPVAAGGTVVSATGTAGGSFLVAYTTGAGDLYSTQVDPP